MKPNRSDDDLERLLADDGGEIGALYRRLPRAEPSPELDKAVLAHAASALRSAGRPPRASSRRRPRWLVGLGSAAGLVLAAGIAWQVGHDNRAQLPAPAAEQPAAPVWIPVQPMDAPSPSPAPAPSVADGVAEESAVAAAPPAVEPSRPPAKAERAPSARLAAVSKPQAAESAPPPPPPPPAPSAAPTAPVAPMTESASADRAAETTALRERFAKPSAADAAVESLSSTQMRSTKRAAGAPSPNSSAELRRDLQLPPEQWIARIQQLQKLGRRQQAIDSLRLFRRAHPDWQLPESLRALDP